MSQVVKVPHPSVHLSCRRCGPAELEPLLDRLDTLLQGDYFFRPKHLAGILARPHNAVWAVLVDNVFAGVMIIYKQTTLWNLYITPEHHRLGLGTALLQFFQPQIVRAKGNMSQGDPTSFYEKNGYVATGVDPGRPHIVKMEKANSPARLEQLAKARAKAAEKKQAAKKSDDYQRLLDSGLDAAHAHSIIYGGQQGAAAATPPAAGATPAESAAPAPQPPALPPPVQPGPAADLYWPHPAPLSRPDVPHPDFQPATADDWRFSD